MKLREFRQIVHHWDYHGDRDVCINFHNGDKWYHANDIKKITLLTAPDAADVTISIAVGDEQLAYDEQ